MSHSECKISTLLDYLHNVYDYSKNPNENRSSLEMQEIAFKVDWAIDGHIIDDWLQHID